MSRKSIVKYLNPWMFKRETQRARIARLRAAYGDRCWQCGNPMSFSMLATRRRATIEHLLPRSRGGTSAWENVRLCHVGCNRHLGVHPPEHKLKMRLALARDLVPEFAAKPTG